MEAGKSVVVEREYEAWFLAAARSLRGKRNVNVDAEPPQDPEEIPGAKEYLERQLFIPGAAYSPTIDQPALTALFDLLEARRCSSFDKLWRDLERLFDA